MKVYETPGATGSVVEVHRDEEDGSTDLWVMYPDSDHPAALVMLSSAQAKELGHAVLGELVGSVTTE